MAAVKTAAEGDDKDLIEKTTQELMEASGNLAQAAAGAAAGEAPEGEEVAAEDDDVVDAEFEEVDETAEADADADKKA